MAATTQQNNPFIKQLAANDRRTRDRALTQLRTYLSRSTPFTPTDLLKLWKGLFYSMWSADKPRYQQTLAHDLADLITCFSTPSNTLLFIQTFWTTMAREWTGIEALRMDKFLYLVRVFLNAGFAYISRDTWANEAVREELMQIMRDVPLNARDPKVPNGLRYHILDIYVDELDKVDTDKTAPVEELLEPLRRLEKEGLTKAVRKRADEALDDERVGDWKGERRAEEEEGDEEEDDEEISEGEGADEDDDEFGGFDD